MQTRDLRKLEARFMNRVQLNESDAEELRQALLSDDGRISRKEANFLVALRNRVPNRTPEFERFFFKALRAHLLDDDLLSAKDAKWLREVLFADGPLDEQKTEFLCQLKGWARAVNPEFESLLAVCMDSRPTQGVAG